MTVKEKTPAEVLTFFLNPNRKYMGHFFYLVGDTPTKAIMIKHDRSGGSTEKTTFSTTRQRLYLSDVDAILKKYNDFKGKHTIADIALGILPPELLEIFDKHNLNVDQVIQWAKKVASDSLTQAKEPAVAKALAEKKASRLNPETKILVKIMQEVKPNIAPSELATFLRGLVNDPINLERAEQVLADKESSLGRDKSGFIRLRVRTHAMA